MGLNIGIMVKKQREGYGCTGRNPNGTLQETILYLLEHLSGRFPLALDTFGCGVELGKDNRYDFDIRFAHYGASFLKQGYTFDAMYLALTEFVLDSFSANDGIEMSLYFVH